VEPHRAEQWAQDILMNDMTGTFSLASQLRAAKAEAPGQVPQQVDEIGFVFQISGSSSQILIDLKSPARSAAR
jgi:hypothetical protein